MILGIDTSNYTTSVALVHENQILEDRRILLQTKKGERGLRQSDALFQHWQNLPQLLTPVLDRYSSAIERIAVSTKPRPQEGSYMPVFNAGVAAAQIVAAALQRPVTELSHQEGHIYAAAYGNDVCFSKPVICAHLSGGTLEVVRLVDGKITIAAQTMDISYGQLLDRTGVALGYAFPAGAVIDRLALSYQQETGVKWKNPLCKIHVTPEGVNLSGIETQVMKNIGILPQEELSFAVMERISQSFDAIIHSALSNETNGQVLISGGVASSKYLRKYLQKENWIFGSPQLCSDNAVGLALRAASGNI